MGIPGGPAFQKWMERQQEQMRMERERERLRIIASARRVPPVYPK